MILDQASLLRELMNKKQQVVSKPVAILSTSDFQNTEEIVECLVEDFSKVTQRRVALFGVDTNNLNSLELCIKSNMKIDSAVERLTPKFLYVPGRLGFLSDIRNKKELSAGIVNSIRSVENITDSLFYYAGCGMDSTAINLAMSVNKAIVLMKPTAQSIVELTNYVKIFSKTKTITDFSIVLDTDNELFFQEQTKKIQELYWKEFKYYIEPMGFINAKDINEWKNKEFKGMKYDYLLNKYESNIFSTSIEKMLMK
jgi:MinD-like ATPase involved in chromosome partitioning or flagellar assembly